MSKSAVSSPTVTKSIIAVVVIAIATALGLGFYLNRQQIFDFFAANSFAAPAEIVDINSKLELTGSGHNIFYATHPNLESQDNFNIACDSHNEEISILGCYTGGKIYIYNISDPELSGVKESTAAHELLHAVWERLSTADKANLSAQLTELYNDSRYHDLLADDIESYKDSEIIEELHSRAGTEIADLPEALEKHYANYFKDQDLIVSFYNSYITPFQELSEEIKNLSSQLEELSATIEQKTADYYKFAEELSAKISEFNDCANTAGCFLSSATFYAQRAGLLGEQSQLNAAYEKLNQLVDEYNQIVEKYNANVLRGEQLENIINSNKQTETIK